MATDLEKRAKEAFVDDNFDLAVDLYTQALDMDPKNADLYADRAQANIKLDNFTEAVADANKATELDPSIMKAYLRKGTACIKLEEYQTAKTALEAGASLAPGDSRFTRLIKECDEHIAEEASDFPKKVMPNDLPSTMSPPSNICTEIRKDPQFPKDSPSQSAIIPNKPKYRHDYYNSSTEVVLTIFAKGIPANNVSVDFGEQMLSVIIDIPGEETYHFQPRLFGKIIPEKCRFAVMSSKIEIHLSKAEPITWTSLEFSDKRTVPQKINTSSAPISKRLSYPSSKSKVDWDKLEALVKKEVIWGSNEIGLKGGAWRRKRRHHRGNGRGLSWGSLGLIPLGSKIPHEEKEEKLDGDAALNKLFQDIYRDADEDVRRAMNKSFIESHGTVLSTNWKDVGSKNVEGSPPEGLELKKWEY